MKPPFKRMRPSGLKQFAFIVAFYASACLLLQPCTIFVLTDADHALFFNNEDWSNPKTRIWFVPSGPGYYGCAFVGFDDGAGQGGLNTEGLAYDVVAGFQETWKADSKLRRTRGHSPRRMLETCATVDDAIAFYQTHQEPGFYRAKLLVADKSGASVIIGAKDGKLQIEKANRCRGFGYGGNILEKMLAKRPEPSIANGVKILRACMQKGQYATKYSNAFDLKSGNIFLFPFPDHDDEVKLNLAAELKKGGHYYDMHQIREQFSQAARPLLTNMKRFLLDEFKPILDNEPKITARLRRMLDDASNGTMRPSDYTAELWKELLPELKAIQADIYGLGDLVSLTPVERTNDDGGRSYRCRLEFKNATVLEHFVLDKHDKVSLSRSEDVEWK